MKLNWVLTAKRTMSASMSLTLSVLMALPSQLHAMDLSAQSFVVTFQTSENKRIIIRDENGNFLGYSTADANFEKEVDGNDVRRTLVNGMPTQESLAAAASKVEDTNGKRYIQYTIPRATVTAEGVLLEPGRKVLLDMSYFLNGDLHAAGVTGSDNSVADEVNDAIFEEARLNPPKEPMAEERPPVAQPTDVETEEGVDEEAFTLNDYRGTQTFARGAPFPNKFLSAPTCDCTSQRGCGVASKYGPRTRPRTGTRTIRRKGKRIRVATYGSAFHKGHDISGGGRVGAKIVAAADGIIKRRQRSSGGYGLALYIDHGNGLETQYAHLNSIAPNIRIGARVKRGDVIGRMGSTGNSSGPHLHFGVWQDGRSINAASRMLIDMNSKSAFNRSCRNLPEYPAVDAAMDRALRGALYGRSRTQTSGRARSTSSR